jgi:hypothetical protein
MSKMILKKTLILSLFALSMSAQAEINKELLANRCYELAQTVTSLVPSQHNPTCVDKLYLASMQMNTAGALILDNSIAAAKQIISNAVSALQYAELTSCKQYIQISHSKLEANKLKHML